VRIRHLPVVDNLGHDPGGAACQFRSGRIERLFQGPSALSTGGVQEPMPGRTMGAQAAGCLSPVCRRLRMPGLRAGPTSEHSETVVEASDFQSRI
jgi:hypothetical protein